MTGKLKNKTSSKMEIYSITAEEMTTYVNNDDIIYLVLQRDGKDDTHVEAPLTALYKWEKSPCFCVTYKSP